MLPIDIKAAEGKCASLPVPIGTGATYTWPVGVQQVDLLAINDAVDLHLGDNTITGAQAVTPNDRTLTHAIPAGGNNAFASANYLRGVTTGAIGKIVTVVDTTHTLVQVTNAIEFSATENVAETTTGLVGGDTGDVALASAIASKALIADPPIPNDGQYHTVHNSNPSTYTTLALRARVANATVEVRPTRL